MLLDGHFSAFGTIRELLEAVHQLHDDGLPFLFFNNPVSGRGHLLCRRYAGGLRLISPIADGRDHDMS